MSSSPWVGWVDRWDTPSAVDTAGTLNVDVHTHLKVPAAADLARPHLKPADDPRTLYSSEVTKELNRGYHALVDDRFVDPERRLEDMDAMGVDIQMLAVAPSQYFYALDRQLALAVTQAQNDHIAAIVAEHPQRFGAVGNLPLRHPDAAVSEAQRLRDLGFHAVEVGAEVSRVDLDDPMFEPVWACLADLGMVAILHPEGFTEGARLTDYYLVNVIGMPLSSTLAVTRMILGGVFARHPALRMLVVHGGGYLPFYSARTDHAFRHRPEMWGHIDRLPSEYLEQIWFDTTVFDAGLVKRLVSEYGADHVLMGSDYPFDMGQGDPVGFLDGCGLAPDERPLVLGENARRLFGPGAMEPANLSNEKGSK